MYSTRCQPLFLTKVRKQSGSQSIPNQHILTRRNASLIRHRTSQPTPQDQSTKAYSIYFNLMLKAKVLLGQNYFRLLRLFLLIVGNLLCLVMLCLISTRRDKVCPQYRVRNWSCTNALQAEQKPCEPVENTCTISSMQKTSRFWSS